MRIILVRHGETVWNVKGRLQGRLGGPLTFRGRRQMKATARGLAGEKIAHVFSSDLERAMASAREIGLFHQAPVEFLHELREIDCGELESKSLQKAMKTHRRELEARLRDKYNYCFPRGESYRDVEARVRPFLRRVRRSFAGKTIVVVSHEAVNRVILKILLNLAPQNAVKVSQPNDCVYFIDVPETGKQATHKKTGHATAAGARARATPLAKPEVEFLYKNKLHNGLFWE